MLCVNISCSRYMCVFERVCVCECECVLYVNISFSRSCMQIGRRSTRYGRQKRYTSSGLSLVERGGGGGYVCVCARSCN